MKLNILVLLFTTLLVGCGSKQEFWPISKFKLLNEALKDEEEIKIIYTSQSPDFNEDLDYFIQLVVVSQLSGDTINVLTTIPNEFTKKDSDKVFCFLDKSNMMTKIALMDLTKLTTEDLSSLSNDRLRDIKKVVRNPQFDFIADNKCPAVIGAVGIIKNTK